MKGVPFRRFFFGIKALRHQEIALAKKGPPLDTILVEGV